MSQAPKDSRTVASGVQKMTPSEAFVETLVANGVTDIFGIMGSAFMDAMDPWCMNKARRTWPTVMPAYRAATVW